MRKTAVVNIVLLALLAGCGQAAQPDALAAEPAAQTQPPAAPATMPAEEVAVRVNGSAIHMSQLQELLLDSYGLGIAQQLVVGELIRQEAQAHDVDVSEADCQAEHEATLAQMFPDLPAGQRERALHQWLAHKSFPYALWEMTMRRNAQLTKLAKQRTQVADEHLRAEFGSRYGRQVRVRHIQLESLEKAESILKEIQGGADFEALARSKSTNPSAAEGGLLPAFGEHTAEVPPAIRQVAMALKNVGDVSNPVQVQQAFHILKLQEHIEPKDVRYEDVKDQLYEAVYAQRLAACKAELRTGLILKAEAQGRIEWVNPVLARKAKEAAESARQVLGQ